jgi:hypothetical protein
LLPFLVLLSCMIFLRAMGACEGPVVGVAEHMFYNPLCTGGRAKTIPTGTLNNPCGTINVHQETGGADSEEIKCPGAGRMPGLS